MSKKKQSAISKKKTDQKKNYQATMTDKQIEKEFLMNKYEERLLTFKGVWPFTVDCLCTPENVIFNTFYFINKI